MSPIQSNDSYMLSQFRDFYTEVIRLKQLIKDSGSPEIATAAPETPTNGNGHKVDPQVTGNLPVVDPALLPTLSGSEKTTALTVRGALAIDREPSPEQSKLARLVWQDMKALFQRQAIEVLRVGGKHTDNYHDALYVMAVLADEVFIHLDWEGNRAWTSNLFEESLFQTHLAGEKFFEKLDFLLQNNDPADKSLAAVYLSALALGFRGKYHGLNDHGRLRRYREELYAFVFQQPQDLKSDSKIAFPDSYVKNLRAEKRKKLTNPRVWLAVLCFVVVAYLAVSHGLWIKLTSRLDHANQKITEVEKRLDAIPPTAN